MNKKLVFSSAGQGVFFNDRPIWESYVSNLETVIFKTLRIQLNVLYSFYLYCFNRCSKRTLPTCVIFSYSNFSLVMSSNFYSWRNSSSYVFLHVELFLNVRISLKYILENKGPKQFKNIIICNCLRPFICQETLRNS